MCHCDLQMLMLEIKKKSKMIIAFSHLSSPSFSRTTTSRWLGNTSLSWNTATKKCNFNPKKHQQQANKLQHKMQQKDQQIYCNIKININYSINININININCKININVNRSIVTSSCKIRNRTFRSKIMGAKGKVMRILRNYTSRHLKIHSTSHLNVNFKKNVQVII